MRLVHYIIRRLILLIPVLIGVSIIVFTLTRLAGDPASAYISPKMNEQQISAVYEKYHFDEPLYVQYFYWASGLVQGDWGYSRTASLPVTEAIIMFFPATLELTLVSIVIAIIVGIALGTISSTRHNKPVDHTIRAISLLGVSIPIFWLALILQLVFYGQLDILPAGGRCSQIYLLQGNIPHITGLLTVDSLLVGDQKLFMDAVWHLILPAVTLAFGTIAIITRIMRNSMLEVLNLDYVRTARAKGLSERSIIKKHARRNALIPTTTVVGLSFGGLLGGAVLTESIFFWPGLGRWSAQSISKLDSNSVMGLCLLVAFIYVLVNLIVDVLYAYLDPRVRLG